ncbi:PorT family protein [candidate division WOR-3 bacterium]|nr:PorT family protein [candidate division WOR-3 bacterium]
MMKGISTIAILLLAGALVFGQGFSVGANAGMSYNILNFDNEGVDTYSDFGFGGGLVLDIAFLPMLGVEVDILYSSYKYSFSGEVLGEPASEIITINNLVVPILLKYKMATSTVSPYFLLGPSIIKNLNGTIEVTVLGVTKSGDISNDKLETDFGFQIGAGANVGVISQMCISPCVRFQYNLTGDRDWMQGVSESMYDFLFGLSFTYKIK